MLKLSFVPEGYDASKFEDYFSNDAMKSALSFKGQARIKELFFNWGRCRFGKEDSKLPFLHFNNELKNH